jgi:hypothetical protein
MEHDFFLFSDLIMRFANFFSLSCAFLCRSTNYCVLRIVILNDYIIEEQITVIARSKAWVCGLLFAWDCEFESNRVHPFLYLVIVVFFYLEVSASVWFLFRRSPTECDLEDPLYEAMTQLKAEITYGDGEN